MGRNFTAAPSNSRPDVKRNLKWLYCAECPQCSIRLEALGYLCARCLLSAFDAAQNPRSSVTWLNSRWSVRHWLGARV